MIPDAVRTRVMHGAHPDLTWVRPSGAHVMRVDDVEGPVVNAAYRTPFEARRRVFVLERVDTMNDEVANRLLKTLEEPASYVHLILMTDQLGRVLETVISRCQLVRFEPLPAATIASHLEAEGVPAERARGMRGACLWGTRRELAIWRRRTASSCARMSRRSCWQRCPAARQRAPSHGDRCWRAPRRRAWPRRRRWRWRRSADWSSSQRAASARRSRRSSRSRRSGTPGEPAANHWSYR